MKTAKFQLICAIFEIVVGVLAILSFVFIIIDESENASKWMGTLFLSLGFILMGISGVIDYKDSKQNRKR